MSRVSQVSGWDGLHRGQRVSCFAPTSYELWVLCSLSTIKFGTSKENVASLVVVTPEGEAIRTRARARKSSTGYDLTQLYMGSEGTLVTFLPRITDI